MRTLALVGAAALLAAAVLLAGRWLWMHSFPGEADLAGAWKRVQAAPRDAEAWAALGDAQAAIDELRAAEESYRTALRLGSEDPSLRARLGFLLYGRGQDAIALELLEAAHEGGADLPLLVGTINELRSRRDAMREAAERERRRLAGAQPAPPDPPAPARGLCSVPLERSGARDVFRIAVLLNGEPHPMIVDTGASLTAVGARALAALGLSADPEATVSAITATGPAEFPTARLERLEIAGRVVRDLTVAVCNDCGGAGAAGLLGLDAQAALGLELEFGKKRAVFADCGAGE